MSIGKVGLIARFKPLHIGGAYMLEAICEHADEVLIGIGSSNKYNLRNPFTAQESEDMVHAYLGGRFNNYSIVHIPDFAQDPQYANGEKWKKHVVKTFGTLDHFISGNGFVKELLQDTYTIMPSYDLIPEQKRTPVRSTEVRIAMAYELDLWKEMVPKEVSEYIITNELDKRFLKEFGEETQLLLHKKSVLADNAEDEKKNAQEK